jgi:DNA-binding NarL/FixJ family response regulator
MLELARVFLEMDGFEVVGEAADGSQAYERYVALDPPPVPSVVLLDNRMPVLSGLEAAERILSHHPDQKVVLFSAHLDDSVEQRARDLGVAACISKMETASLPTILREVLAG